MVAYKSLRKKHLSELMKLFIKRVSRIDFHSTIGGSGARDADESLQDGDQEREVLKKVATLTT